MKNKIISAMLAATIVCGTIPAQSTERTEESIAAASLVSQNNKLQDGTYTIPVIAKNESKPDEDSTANSYLNNKSNLYIKDGKMYLELKFKDATPIKEIGVKVNDAEPDECDIQGVGSKDITLRFKIDSLDDIIILPMKINPLGFFTVSASAIINLDKSELRDENGDIVDLDSIPGNDGDIDNEPGDDGSDDNESNDSDTEIGDSSEDNGSDKNLSDILEEGLVYTVENNALNETSSAESLARQFLDSTSKLEVENGTTYVTIKFLGRSLMSNQKILVNNVETPYEVINEVENASNDELDIKFPITSLSDKIKISMYVSAINQNVAFRLQFDETTVKDPDGNSVNVGSGNEDKIEDAPELDLTVNKKYKASNIVRGSNGDTTPIIANYIEEYSIVEVADNNLYVYITFTNSGLMTYRELTVNGVKQNFSSTVNPNGSYTIKVKLNSINDDMEFTNLLTRSISDGFKIRINGNTLVEYKEESNDSDSSNDSSDDDDLDDGKYTIKNKVLKEDSDSESIARDYVDTESEIEVKNNKMYLTLKFTKGSLMSNVSVKVNDKKVSHEVVKKSGDKYHIKFKIGSLSDEILVSSRIMDSMDVKFRVLLRSSTLDEIDSDDDEEDDEIDDELIENDDELSGSDNINDNISGSEGNNTVGTGNSSPDIDSSTTESYTKTTYSIKNKVICDSQIGYQAARDAINELSYLEHENNKIYLTLNLQNTDLMSNIRVSVAGSEVKYNTFNKDSAANTMSIKFEIPNENPNITIKAYIGMISRDISFGLNLLQDTKTFIKSEEINASQLENISSGSVSSNGSGSSNNSSGDSSSSADGTLAGGGSSADMSTVTEQLANSTIEASEYFKRYTINNEVISDSSMGKMMARKYLNEISILEEIDGQFYITVTFTGTGAMDNFRFVVNGSDVQHEIILDDSANGIKSFRFPISSVNDSIQAYIFIKPVKMNIDFGIKLLEDTMVLIEEGTVEDGTLDQDSSLLSDIVDKATKSSSTGEVSPVKIAISTSTLTIVLNQLVNLLTSYLKNRKKKISINK